MKTKAATEDSWTTPSSTSSTRVSPHRRVIPTLEEVEPARQHPPGTTSQVSLMSKLRANKLSRPLSLNNL